MSIHYSYKIYHLFCDGVTKLIQYYVAYYLQKNVQPFSSFGLKAQWASLWVIIRPPISAHERPTQILSQTTLLKLVDCTNFQHLYAYYCRFLDKAAIVTEEDNLKSGQAPNFWRLNTVHRVEELKSVIRMGPIWAAGILLITAYAQQSTFSILQAKTMNRHITKSFQIPAGSMTVFAYVTMLTTIAFYDRLFIPLARKLTGLDRGITFLHRMGIGFVISILATLVAGFVEVKRKNVALAHGLIDQPHPAIPISVFWLVPQYCLHGIAEAFMSIGHLEFFYDQAPESMRSTAMALFWLAISFGNYVSSLLVSVVHKFSAGPNGSNWLRNDNLTKGKLEYFYWLLTLLQVVNLIYYLYCAKIYTYKPVQVHGKESGTSEEDGVELANRVQLQLQAQLGFNTVQLTLFFQLHSFQMTMLVGKMRRIYSVQ